LSAAGQIDLPCSITILFTLELVNTGIFLSLFSRNNEQGSCKPGGALLLSRNSGNPDAYLQRQSDWSLKIYVDSFFEKII
jgi:hypothetical protein